jgi:sulfatase maturation enzyme AslB (radical SAM superfamily)
MTLETHNVSAFTNGLNIIGFLDLFKRFKYVIGTIMTTIDGTKEHHNQIRGGKHYFDTVINGIDSILKINIPNS